MDKRIETEISLREWDYTPQAAKPLRVRELATLMLMVLMIFVGVMKLAGLY